MPTATATVPIEKPYPTPTVISPAPGEPSVTFTAKSMRFDRRLGRMVPVRIEVEGGTGREKVVGRIMADGTERSSSKGAEWRDTRRTVCEQVGVPVVPVYEIKGREHGHECAFRQLSNAAVRVSREGLNAPIPDGQAVTDADRAKAVSAAIDRGEAIGRVWDEDGRLVESLHIGVPAALRTYAVRVLTVCPE